MKINVNEEEIDKIIKQKTMIMNANINYLQNGLQILKGEILLNNSQPLVMKYPSLIENKEKLIIKKEEKEKMKKNFEKNDKFFLKVFQKISSYHKEINKLKTTIKHLKTQNKKIQNSLQVEIKNNITLKTVNEKLTKMLKNQNNLSEFQKNRTRNDRKNNIKKSKSFSSYSKARQINNI